MNDSEKLDLILEKLDWLFRRLDDVQQEIDDHRDHSELSRIAHLFKNRAGARRRQAKLSEIAKIEQETADFYAEDSDQT